jgi:hypothetical protein
MIEVQQWGAVFSVQSVPRCYKRDKLGAAISQLWDIRQPVRSLAQDIVRIRYQETTSEAWEDFMCAVVTAIFGVYNSVRLVVICT